MQIARLAGLAVLIVVQSAGLLSVRAQGPEVEQLMAKLADPDFKTRMSSQEKLIEWGLDNLDAGIALFYGSYRGAEDPEVRSRSREILRELVIFKQSGEGKGYLGIRMQAEDLMVEGGQIRPVVRITKVMEGTPAEKAGLEAEDLIVGIDEVDVAPVDALETFGAYVQSKKPRTNVTLHLLRGGKPKDIVVNLMRRPPDLEERAFLWGGAGGYVPPPQEELEEEEFREWLKVQREKARQSE